MRRDYFTLNADGVSADEPGAPVVTITYEGPTAELESRLERGGEALEAGDIDVSYRLQDSLDDASPTGVVAIADRVTGEYILELNADAGAVLDVTDAVDDGDGDGHYRLRITTEEGEELATYEKSTLLVYDADGDLLRERSLIPSGVEI
jgi:hypothetical protein